MGSVYVRRKKLWLAYIDETGKQKCKSSGFAVGEELQARRLLEEIEKQIKAGEPATAGPMTVGRYMDRWLKARKDRVAAVGHETAALKNHVEPVIGKMRLDEVRPRHVRDLVLALRGGDTLAPRTVRKIYGTLRRMFRSAQIEEYVAASPCTLEANVLPKNIDSDPRWRSQAIYSRPEIEALISDERLPQAHRVLYGLKALGALRHGEAASLRWSDYDPTAEPLGRMTVATSYERATTKTGTTRQMPVHPALAALLAAWKLSGWAEAFGHKPEPDDLIVPNSRGHMWDRHGAQDRLVEDLTVLGLRVGTGAKLNRRGHDFRRTMITLAQVDGAAPHILKVATHGAAGDIISVYTTLPWPAVCAEVAKLRIGLRGTEPIAMPIAANDAGVYYTSTTRAEKPNDHAAENTKPRLTMSRGPLRSRGRPSFRSRS